MDQAGGTPLNMLILKLDLCIAVNCANSLVPQCHNSKPAAEYSCFFALFCFKQKQFLKVGVREK